MIKLKKFIASRWQNLGDGEFRLVREIITASSLTEATRICDIRQLNEVAQLLE